MKLKVCGMGDSENIREILKSDPDYIGFIFYEKSKRFVDAIDLDVLREIEDQGISKVGVFVNASIEEVEEKWRSHRLDFVQLHGDESVAYGRELQKIDIQIIKVFRITDVLPKSEIQQWEDVAELFLFDTATEGYGGSGEKFGWEILSDYSSEVEYLLSGGIDLEDLDTIQNMDLPGMIGIDVNSKFEVSPRWKDAEKVQLLKELIYAD